MLFGSHSLALEQTVGGGVGGKVMLLPPRYLCWGTVRGKVMVSFPWPVRANHSPQGLKKQT